ncbi:MAG: GIY-YIG nuclease family protein [Bacteroides sp.]|nr:GIY-YIG nuclease family protein [Bacteroides sp.]MCM1550814.1 GIY-YIG nuclease family protein [Clostridium sp.]
MNYTYILECSDKSLYTGWTTDLERRLAMHNQGKGAKYTFSRRPVKLVYFEEFGTREEAMKREYAIKQLSRQEKQKLILEYQKRQYENTACEKTDLDKSGKYE